MKRREFLSGTAAVAALGSVAGAGVTVVNSTEAKRPMFERASVAGMTPHIPERPEVFDVGNRKQLFLDDLMLDRVERISKFVGRVQKYEHNPILLPDKPWERGWTGSDGAGYTGSEQSSTQNKQITRTEGLRITGQTALYDEEEKLFKLWYLPWLWPDLRSPWCYAVSTDGYRWERPELGMFEFEGSNKNNILSATRDIDYFNVVKDPHDPDPNRRYKAMGESERPGQPQGVCVAFSPDGLRWTESPGNPVVLKGANVTDAPTMLGWDSLKKKYVAYYRPGAPIYTRRMRTIGYSESDDFEHWTDTRLMLAMDDLDRVDYEYMQFTVGVHGDFYVGFLMIYEKHEKTWNTYLLSSRDGFHWTWVDRNVPFLSRGEIGSYDAAYMTPCGPIVHDGKIWIYYGAFRTAHTFLPTKFGTHDIMTIALATLPEDRYVGLLGSVDENNEPAGMVLTHPLRFAGNKLFLDFDSSTPMQQVPHDDPRHCQIRAAIFDESGEKIEAFSLEKCTPLYDEGRHEMRWIGSELSQLEGQPIRLMLHIQNAALYSFQFV
ncbi:MAG: hypothetical protein ACKVT0_09405 [Planctomycetaceae bacterium]